MSAIVHKALTPQVVAGILIGCRTHPQQAALAIVVDTANAGFLPIAVIGCQRCVVHGAIAVIAAQSVIGSHPDISFVVLHQFVDGIAGQPISSSDMTTGQR